MSNAIVALVVIALMLVASLSWSHTAFTSLDSVSQTLKETTQTAQEVSRTDIEVVGVQIQGAFVEVSVLNSGKVRLAQFANWDVMVQYYDATEGYHIGHLSYNEDANPGDNQWIVANIYLDEGMGQQEVYEPGILNPGEVLLLRLKLAPTQGAGITNLVAISTASGVVASAQFEG
jgi:hypothetical protein